MSNHSIEEVLHRARLTATCIELVRTFLNNIETNIITALEQIVLLESPHNQCPLCSISYSSAANQPMRLLCRHTICSACLVDCYRLFQYNPLVECPFCEEMCRRDDVVIDEDRLAEATQHRAQLVHRLETCLEIQQRARSLQFPELLETLEEYQLQLALMLSELPGFRGDGGSGGRDQSGSGRRGRRDAA